MNTIVEILQKESDKKLQIFQTFLQIGIQLLLPIYDLSWLRLKRSSEAACHVGAAILAHVARSGQLNAALR